MATPRSVKICCLPLQSEKYKSRLGHVLVQENVKAIPG